VPKRTVTSKLRSDEAPENRLCGLDGCLIIGTPEVLLIIDLVLHPGKKLVHGRERRLNAPAACGNDRLVDPLPPTAVLEEGLEVRSCAHPAGLPRGADACNRESRY